MIFRHLVIFAPKLDPGPVEPDSRLYICRRPVNTNTESVSVQTSANSTELEFDAETQSSRSFRSEQITEIVVLVKVMTFGL